VVVAKKCERLRLPCCIRPSTYRTSFGSNATLTVGNTNPNVLDAMPRPWHVSSLSRDVQTQIDSGIPGRIWIAWVIKDGVRKLTRAASLAHEPTFLICPSEVRVSIRLGRIFGEAMRSSEDIRTMGPARSALWLRFPAQQRSLPVGVIPTCLQWLLSHTMRAMFGRPTVVPPPFANDMFD
jgi:hypothetical protein